MQLYLDNQYPPSLFNIIKSVHDLQYPQSYRVVFREWRDENNADDTVVFLIDNSKKGVDQHALSYFRDGYRVFTYRKPYGKPYDLFKQTLILLSTWQKILKIIETEKSPYIYTINESTKPLLKFTG